MLHHILVKWNDQVTDKKETNRLAAEAFAGATTIPGVSACELIPSCSDRSNRYDLMIRLTMTWEGLQAYDVSDMHAAWKKNFSHLMESKCIFDCEE